MRNKTTKNLLWIFKDAYKLSVKLHELGTSAHSYLQQFCTHRKNSYVYGFFYNKFIQSGLRH